jgi:hypothetical protein
MIITRKRTAALAALSLSCAAPTVAQTCTPPACNPTLPAPAPSATPVVRTVCRDRDILILLVTQFDSQRVAVSSIPEIRDVALTANGRIFHPMFTSRDLGKMIEPAEFVETVRYHAKLPGGLSGVATLDVGPGPTITFNLDTLNPCPW